VLRHETLPLTPNGKIDRQRLPAPDTATGGDATDFIAPVTATEALLAEIWREVLRVEAIGRHDHFFAIGGHSLLATQVVSRLRRRLGIELPLRGVFAAPMLDALAAQIDLLLAQQRLALSVQPATPADSALSNDEREEFLI
jgi:hypothetical protein